ncbi:hypothetical protein HD806DRAFT_529600 [Xylariaceae sp. AK1471]|nr:hypothetical protein HD806DRAFT_529600 [Xylariaceae sp. AK1471]
MSYNTKSFLASRVGHRSSLWETLPQNVYHLRFRHIGCDKPDPCVISIPALPLSLTTHMVAGQIDRPEQGAYRWRFCPACSYEGDRTNRPPEMAFAFDNETLTFLNHYAKAAANILHDFRGHRIYVESARIIWGDRYHSLPPQEYLRDKGEYVAHSSAVTRRHLEIIRDRAVFGENDKIDVEFSAHGPDLFRENWKTKLGKFLRKR